MEVDAVLEYAIVLSKKGYSRKKVMNILNKEGVPLSVAFVVVEKVYALQAKAYRDAGMQTLRWGFLFVFIGTLITLGTYLIIASSGGGFFVITKGLFFVGCINILRGIRYLIKSYFM